MVRFSISIHRLLRNDPRVDGGQVNHSWGRREAEEISVQDFGGGVQSTERFRPGERGGLDIVIFPDLGFIFRATVGRVDEIGQRWQCADRTEEVLSFKERVLGS